MFNLSKNQRDFLMELLGDLLVGIAKPIIAVISLFVVIYWLFTDFGWPLLVKAVSK